MKHGFTLIELLVVISIIGVLMGIGFMAFKQAQTAGRDAKRKADLEQIKTALELFHEECGKYPSILSKLNTGDPWEEDCDNDGTKEVYLAKMPQDPLYPTYSYYYGGSTNFHTLCTYLERGDAGGYKAAGYTACWNGLSGRYLFNLTAASCGAAACNYSVLTVR